MKIQCECGSLIHDGADGLPHKAHIIPDQSWDALFDRVDELIETQCSTAADRDAACTKIRSLFTTAARLAWQCGACGRVYIDDAARRVECFVPATAAASRAVFRAQEGGS